MAFTKLNMLVCTLAGVGGKRGKGGKGRGATASGNVPKEADSEESERGSRSLHSMGDDLSQSGE